MGQAAGLLRKGAVARALKLRRRRRDERAPSELSAARQSGRPVGLVGRWGLVSGSSAICQPAQVVRPLAGLMRLVSQTGSQCRQTPGYIKRRRAMAFQLDHLSGPGQPRAATGRMRLKSEGRRFDLAPDHQFCSVIRSFRRLRGAKVADGRPAR